MDAIDQPSVKILPMPETRVGTVVQDFTAFVIAEGDIPRRLEPVRPSAPTR